MPLYRFELTFEVEMPARGKSRAKQAGWIVLNFAQEAPTVFHAITSAERGVRQSLPGVVLVGVRTPARWPLPRSKPKGDRAKKSNPRRAATRHVTPVAFLRRTFPQCVQRRTTPVQLR